MHLRLAVPLLLVCLLGPAVGTASAAKVTKLGPWAASNKYLVKANTDGRVTPKLEPRAKVDWIKAGTWVKIQCQTTGEAAYGSTLWAKVGKYYVPDQMLKTYSTAGSRAPRSAAPGRT